MRAVQGGAEDERDRCLDVAVRVRPGRDGYEERESWETPVEFPGELQLMEEDDVDAILPWPGVFAPRGLRPTGGLTAQPRVYPWIGDLLPWLM
jgi:hypothetical protein